MTSCFCCNEPILNGQNLFRDNWHQACHDEYWTRKNDHKCVYCKNTVKTEPGICEDCISTKNMQYSGYSGPK